LVLDLAGLPFHFSLLVFPYSAGDRSSIYRRRSTNVAFPIVITAAGKGGGVLDRPAEKVSPGRQSEFDVK
jgi:ATP-dependent Clp protease adaptor protein ClpS